MPLKKSLTHYKAQNTLASPEEQMDAQDAAANSTEGVLGAAASFAENTLDAIPGARVAQAKLLALAGIPEDFTAKKQDQLTNEHTIAALGGNVAGSALLGKVLTAPLKGASAIKQIGIQALAASVMEPAFKMAEIAHEAETKAQALATEQYSHAFSLPEMLGAGLLTAVTGTALRGAGAAGKLATAEAKHAKNVVQGTATALGASVGGLPGALVAGGASGAALNTAFAKKLFGALPEAGKAFDSRIKSSLNTILGTGSNLISQGVGKIGAEYDSLAEQLRSSTANPDGVASHIRAHLGSLPANIADAVTANTMNKLQGAALMLPENTSPATAFGATPSVSDRQKREFLRKTQAIFDPLSAVESGREDLIRVAEEYNPETINHVRNEVVKQLSDNPKLPYMTKRKVLGILGVAGTPGQDPLVGSGIQQAIQQKNAATTTAGQMGSARQMKANLKQDKATLTTAQKILNEG